MLRNLFRGIKHNNYQMELKLKIKCVSIGRFKRKLHRCVQNLIPFPNKRSLDPFENNWRNIFLYLKINFSSQFVCRLCTGLSCSVSELYVSHNCTKFVQGPLLNKDQLIPYMKIPRSENCYHVQILCAIHVTILFHV